MNWLAMLATPLVVILWMMARGVEGQADGSFWWLKKSTSGPLEPDATTPSGPQQPCICVKYYLCINGTISTSGAGLIDVRLGGGHQRPPPRNRDASSITQCPDLYDVCCVPPNPITTTAVTTPTTTPEPTLPPDTPCECVSFFNCTAERIVNDGEGNTTLVGLGFTHSHSACPHALTVCCAFEPNTTTMTLSTTLTTPSPTHSHCDCVDPYLCDITGTILTSGSGLMDLRTRRRNPNPDIVCEDTRQICCNKPPSTLTTATTISTMPTTPALTSPPVTTSIPTTPSCGTRNEMGIAARILGFKEGESQFGEFPWVTAILRQDFIMDKRVHLFVGGGTLIHPRVVITAAHKVAGVRPSRLWVRAGEWDTRKTYEAYAHQNRQVEEVLVHPNFDGRALFNDLALLFLKEEVEEAPHISKICIADDLEKVNASSCVINGWGKDGFEDVGAYQTIMKSMTLPLVDHKLCQTQLRSTRLGPYFRLHPSFLCAGGELGKDACTGDGGGPLACPRLDDPTHYLLVGVTAWGIGCGQDGIPGVYASIPANYDWIRNETYSRFPPPTTTTPLQPSTEPTEYEDEEYVNSLYDESEETRTNRRLERERRKKERREKRRQKEEEKRRQKEEKKRRRERRRRQRQRQN